MKDFQESKEICTIEELRTSYLYLEFNKVVSLFFYITRRKERGKILIAYSYVKLLLYIRRKSLFKKWREIASKKIDKERERYKRTKKEKDGERERKKERKKERKSDRER